MNHDVPLIANSKDGMHCAQAIYLMILKYFRPKTDETIDSISPLTGFLEGSGSWLTAGMLWFEQQGFAVKCYTGFDYDEFARVGKEYLIKTLPPEEAEWDLANTDFPIEQGLARKLTKSEIISAKKPSIDSVKVALANDCLVHVTVDSNTLDGWGGEHYGHGVLLTGYTKETIFLNDPGLPAEKREVSLTTFEAAWSQHKEFVTYRLA